MKSMLKSLMSVAAAALALTSCSNDATEDVIPNGGSQTLEVNASIDQTRTTLAANHVDLNWSADDEILLYIGETATVANKIKPASGGKITGVTYKEGDMVYANYSIDNAKYSKGVTLAQINIKAEQTQSEANVFAGENLPMVAKGPIENGKVNLTFNPVGCVLVFNVYGTAYNSNEKIKSIKFETSVGCNGYKNCNLTLEKLDYTAYENSKSATVTLTTPAAIGTAKPSDTKIGENQVYMVVAPVNYEDATITVNTTIDPEKGDIYNTYTFKTANGIDCLTNSARVVNLNLAKAAVQPAIEVPTVPQQLSEGGQLSIKGIVFKNIADDQIANAEVGVYSDEELNTEPLTESWITVVPNTAILASGELNCTIAANETTENRTLYIGIKCGDVKAAIAITQLGSGSTPAESSVVTYTPSKMDYDNQEKVTSATLNNGAVTLAFAGSGTATAYYTSGTALRCYAKNTITVSSTSKISKIVIVRAETDKKANKLLDNNKQHLSDDTWTGESNEVVLTVDGTSGHIRIASIEITYGKGSGSGDEQHEPTIEVPAVDQQPAEGGPLAIDGIVFKNIDVTNVTTGVYSDAELTQSLDGAWLTIDDSNLASGNLRCEVAANETTESRTAYIGIKCAKGTEVVAQAAIAVTQAKGGSTEPDQPIVGNTASLTLADITAVVGSYNGQYYDTTFTAADGSVWTGFVAGNGDRLQLGWNTTPTKNAAKSYLLVPNADKVIKKITFTPEATTGNGRVLALLPENFVYNGESAGAVKEAAYAYTDNTVKGSTEPLSIDLTGKNLKRFMIRAVGGAVYLTNITIEYAE